MKNKFILVLIGLVVVASIIGGLIQVRSISAAASTSIHIVKYDANRNIIDEETIDISTMESTLPVKGDDTTHYYTQGPNFNEALMWDPTENYDLLYGGDSLKDKGALKGTALKDLCNLVGGMSPGDQVNVMASDGYNDNFDYPNVYNTLSESLNARQGSIVVCWKKDGQYSGTGTGNWTDGMMLGFMPDSSTARVDDNKIIFGHQDMHDCLPQHDWHYYYQNSIAFPSTHGLWIKYVTEISIYEGGANNWNVTLTGARNETLSQNWFGNCIACHEPSTYNDGAGNVWSGLPLWYVCGLVDDTNIHGPGAFNDSLYYNIRVIGGLDNYSYTFPSTTIARNNNYILANKLNGQLFDEDKYPLKLVSPNFIQGGPSVAQINRIDLLNIGTSPPTIIPPSNVQDWPLQLIGASNYTITQDLFEGSNNGCLKCHPASEYTDEQNNVWKGLPLWMLAARVDDGNTHAFNDTLAATNYEILVNAADGYHYSFYSASAARNNDIIIASKVKLAGTSQFIDLPMTTTNPDQSVHPAYPLKATGSATASGDRIGGIVQIRLMLSTPTPTPTPTSTPSAHPWDFNGNHGCDIGDVVIVGLHWGETGTHGWIPQDLNTNGGIDIGDVVIVGLHWGETY
jgi:hypothetical protein